MSAAKQVVIDYFSQHDLTARTQQGLNLIAQQKPRDPFLFLSHFFRSLSTTPRVVFVLGGPGAGKGTQCANIERDFGWVHLSAGDLLREARQSGNETGKMIDEFIREGKIVPVEVTVNLLKTAMEKNIQHGRFDFLIDGFPRNAENLEGWKTVMGEAAAVEFVLFFDCPEHVMEQRLLQRGETSGRTDDNIESIKKRFATYIESTMPVIEKYEKLGKVRRADSTHSIDKVYNHVASLFEQLRRPPYPTLPSSSSSSSSSSFSSSSLPSKVVFVLGGPGSGKGTQCANIVRDFGFVHLSAGDLLREARQSGNETGKMIDEYIREGRIVPVEVTVKLLKTAMEEAIKSGKKPHFLIDGFPRNKDNLDGWHQVIGNWATVEFVLFFDCPEHVMEQRLLKRGETSGRTDDNIESIKKRFATYIESTMPVIEHYGSQGKTNKINSTPPPDAVYAEVQKLFSAYPW